MWRPSLLIFGVAVLSISPINCVGTAFIENWCDFEVYVWSVADVPNNTINHLAAATGGYSETYRTNPNGGGISLKIATVPVDSNITQFEYTYLIDNSYIYYNISNINGTPFQAWGLALSPSTPTLSPCGPISCDPGMALCPGVYNEPTDDYVVQACDLSVDLILTLCPFDTAMVTATEPAAATTTTDTGGNTFLSAVATVPTTIEPTTIPLSQTTIMATKTAVVTAQTTDPGGNVVKSTLTSVFTLPELTTIPPSTTATTGVSTVTTTIQGQPSSAVG
jgi:hypothetical protein